MEHNVKLTGWIDIVTGVLVAGHGIATATRAPLRTRSQRMDERGFEPGVPHALGVPALQALSGLGLIRASIRRAPRTDPLGIASTIAATALGGTRLVVDLGDETVSGTTGAAGALALVGTLRLITLSRRPVVRILAVGASVAATAFEVARRRRVLAAR
jgi:hypothetical protein